MLKSLCHLSILIIGFTLLVHTGLADEPILSPEAVINAIEGTESSLPSENRTNLDYTKLEIPSLSNKEAGTIWSVLLFKWLEAKGSEDELNKLFENIPPPESWGTIAEAINQEGTSRNSDRKLAPLKLLFALMMNDSDSAEKVYSLVNEKPAARSSRYRHQWQQNQLLSAYQEILLTSNLDKSFRQSVFLDKLKLASEPESYMNVDLSTVADLFSGEEAKEVLTRILHTPDLDVSAWYVDDSKTLEAAVRIALKDIDKLKKPPWYLVRYNLPDSLELFDKLSAIDQDNDESWTYSGAVMQRLMGYLKNQQMSPALELFKAQNEDEQLEILSSAIYEISENPALADPFFEFYNDHIYSWNPSIISWPNFLEISIIAEKVSDFEKKLDIQLGASDLDPLFKNELLMVKAQSLLSQNKIDAAMKIIHTQLSQKDFEDTYELLLTALNYATIGYLENNNTWQHQGYQFAQKSANESSNDEKPSFYSMIAGQMLLEGQFAEAQSIIIAGMKAAVTNSMTTDSSQADGYEMMDSPWIHYMGPMHQSGSLSDLAAMNLAIYAQKGRYEDVLLWLNQVPWWGASDLVDLNSSVMDKSVKVMVARALWKEGNAPLARRIIHEYLEFHDAGNDSAYQLLVEIDGSAALPFLRKLAKANRFEERPLIWEGTILLNEGKFAQAEKLIMSAIEIDPSDGEQGKGDRMRAYSVLSEIKAAQGKAEDAVFFENVIQAIRLAEEADDFYEAGLTQKAIDMYNESLDFFQDAYCIQSRMAIQLSEQGDFKEAAKHYKKAFELMPSSFGRVESHCFGCEGAFEGPLAQSIAEKVFTDMLKAEPTNPRLQYLMGYLKDSQGDSEAALKFYWEAIVLDPDYLNAWKKLLAYDSLSTEQGIQVIEAIIRLEPRNAQDTVRSISLGYFSSVWDLLNATLSDQSAPPASLLKLDASMAYENQAPTIGSSSHYRYDANSSLKNSAQALATNYQCQTLLELFRLSVSMP